MFFFCFARLFFSFFLVSSSSRFVRAFVVLLLYVVVFIVGVLYVLLNGGEVFIIFVYVCMLYVCDCMYVTYVAYDVIMCGFMAASAGFCCL